MSGYATPEFKSELADQLAVDIRRHFGLDVTARDGRITMSEWDWTFFERAVWQDSHLDELGRGYYLGAVPIDRRPDWMFDPLTITWLRLTATLIVALHLRQITNWLTRTLTPNGETR